MPQVLQGTHSQVAGMPVWLHVGILILANQGFSDAVKALRIGLHTQTSTSHVFLRSLALVKDAFNICA